MEFKSAEELAKERMEMEAKMAKHREEKRKNISSKADSLEENFRSGRKSDDIYEEARKSIEYYSNLKEKGELLPEDEIKLEEAEKLVKENEEKIELAKKREVNLMDITEIESEVRSRALGEKEQREAKENIENRIELWKQKLVFKISEAEKLLEERNSLWEKFELEGNSLDKIISSKNKLKPEIKKELLETNVYKFARGDFEKELKEYRETSGTFNWGEKGEIDDILKSDEYQKVLAVAKKYADFLQPFKRGNNSYLYPYLVSKFEENDEEFFREYDNIQDEASEAKVHEIYDMFRKAVSDLEKNIVETFERELRYYHDRERDKERSKK
ncbi:MAG: hypothetical protein V1804_02240 [Patescibacteria group bacterium]